jgi:peptide/nickel transport system substrate-binding protein
MMKGPNPVLLNQLTELRIMSKAWAEKNKSVEPKDIKTKDETFAHRNAMGTGQFMVKEWQPDQKLVLVKNPNYWGNNRWQRHRGHLHPHQVRSHPRRGAACRARWTSCSTRVLRIWGALRNNANLKVMDGVENRTIFSAWTSSATSCQAPMSRARTRSKTCACARPCTRPSTATALHRVTMRGLSQPTGAIVAPQVNGWTEAVHKRLPFDAECVQKAAGRSRLSAGL